MSSVGVVEVVAPVGIMPVRDSEESNAMIISATRAPEHFRVVTMIEPFFFFSAKGKD